MKKILIILGVLIILSMGIFYFQKKPENLNRIESIIKNENTKRTYPESTLAAPYSISEINTKYSLSGEHSTSGFVVKKFECPKCPPGAMCKMKPCMGDNIIISENNTLLEDYSHLTDTEMIVFVNNPNQFKLGVQYLFTVNLKYNNPKNEFELVGYSLNE